MTHVPIWPEVKIGVNNVLGLLLLITHLAMISMLARVMTVMVSEVFTSLQPHLLMLSHVSSCQWWSPDWRESQPGNNYAGNEETRGGGHQSRCGDTSRVLGPGQSTSRQRNISLYSNLYFNYWKVLHTTLLHSV